MADTVLIALAAFFAVYALLRFLLSPERRATLEQLAMCLFGFVLFVVWAPWRHAMSRQVALDRYPDIQIPEEWRVVVVNHGEPHQWHFGTVEENPLGYAICTILFIATFARVFLISWRRGIPLR